MHSVARTIPTELDEITLRRASRGEAAASRALVEMYQVRVFALVSRIMPASGRASVEDVAQDTFLQVFRQLPAFDDAGPARLSTWILTIAARRAIDELRRKRPAPSADVDRVAVERTEPRRREIARALEAALGELSAGHRAAFLLRELHGMEYAAIASALGIDLGTVKSRLSRARAALRERLAEVHDGGR